MCFVTKAMLSKKLLTAIQFISYSGFISRERLVIRSYKGTHIQFTVVLTIFHHIYVHSFTVWNKIF